MACKMIIVKLFFTWFLFLERSEINGQGRCLKVFFSPIKFQCIYYITVKGEYGGFVMDFGKKSNPIKPTLNTGLSIL